jgi:hypothetical protein
VNANACGTILDGFLNLATEVALNPGSRCEATDDKR